MVLYILLFFLRKHPVIGREGCIDALKIGLTGLYRDHVKGFAIRRAGRVRKPAPHVPNTRMIRQMRQIPAPRHVIKLF